MSFRVEGLPPYKDRHFSIRNKRHKIYGRFKDLRKIAINAMNGRAPFRGAVGLDIVIHAPELESKKSLNDYMGGVMDTLDGSSGVEFTFLPIAYEDDCQVASGRNSFIEDQKCFYIIEVTFLQDRLNGEQNVDPNA